MTRVRTPRLALAPAGPPLADTLPAALNASLDLLDLLPFAVAVSLVAATFLAVLQAALGDEAPVFTPWLRGPSGALKSELEALAMGHSGDFPRLTLPAKFRDTAHFHEGLCVPAEDALIAVDDYHLPWLLRGVGNGAGRGRVRADATLWSD